MSKLWVVVGDRTTCGGAVITGCPTFKIRGLPVARVTDKATCPTHKGVFPIVTGDAARIVFGQPVARHGDKLGCGCALISGQQMSTQGP